MGQIQTKNIDFHPPKLHLDVSSPGKLLKIAPGRFLDTPDTWRPVEAPGLEGLAKGRTAGLVEVLEALKASG